MTVLSIREIYEAARGAGFDQHQAVTWTGIALAESRGRTTAVNAKGEHSVGLWQINVAGNVRQNRWGDLHDPENNAKAAYEISRQGRDMRPWTTTHDRNQGTAADYRTYLGKVEAEIGVKGDPRGVDGYHADLPAPLDYGPTYDEIDPGRPLAAATTAAGETSNDSKDTDHDGLTDEFERLAGTDLERADTDGDGLGDGYEAMSSHTDPLAADTDSDGLSDPAELAAGTDPGRLPGTAGVVGTGAFAENVRNGVVDADADGLSDRTEKLVGTDAGRADTDRDGLDDAAEAALGTNPTVADSDHDGIADGLDVSSGGDPLGPVTTAGGGSQPTPPWTLEGALASRSAPTPGTRAAEPADDPPESSKLDVFLKQARAQRGDTYLYGATPKLSNADPKSFDCSSLTQWAAHKAGVKIPRTAEYQYMDLKQRDLLVPVDEALKTPGALLFYFSREPTSSLPAGQAHVAISKGDGRTIEAKGRAYGVGEFSGKNRFNYAGVIPGISDTKGLKEYQQVHAARSDSADDAGADRSPDPQPTAPDTGTDDQPYAIDSGTTLGGGPGGGKADPDTDHDGLTDAFEKLVGSDAKRADTDGDGLSDGYESVTSHTDPLSADTDVDGLSDPAELAAGTDAGRLPGTGGVVGRGAYAENVRAGFIDADSDGLSDHTEKVMGTKAGTADTDVDGLSDSTEAALGTSPTVADTDGDGMADGLEVRYHSDPLQTGASLGGHLGADLGSSAPGDPGGLAAAAAGLPDPAGHPAEALGHG